MNFVFSTQRPPLLFSVLLVGFLTLSWGCQPSANPNTKPDSALADLDRDGAGRSDASIGSVTIEVVLDAGPSSKTVSQSVAINENETLESAMQTFANQNQPPLDLAISGKGMTAFVQSIDSIPTDASRGWTFTIDGEFATQGIGSTQLSPGQTIRWRFTTFEQAMQKE